MKRKDKSLFIAYLAFIFVCIIIRCFYTPGSGSDYEVFFQKLIIGVTLSSYFFVVSDGMSSTSERKKYKQDKVSKLGKEIISLSNERIIEIENKDNPSEEEMESRNELKDSVKAIEKTISHWPDRKPFDILAVVFSVIGFLVFLLCLSFKDVVDYFMPQQETFTLLAFFFMLANPYFDELANQRVDESVNYYRNILGLLKTTY